MSSAQLLRDVIDVPERINSSDFVIQLHSGVEHAQKTLDEYVVTESIADAFDQALGLIGSALRGRSATGAFIHGSFGSGKSHFMATMHLLLAGNPHARALTGLQHVVARHDATLGKKFLSVDYHLLEKQSVEHALFSGYLDTVTALHPDAAPPVLHRSDSLLVDAAKLRAQMGDESFFAGLGPWAGGVQASGGGFGSRVQRSPAQRFDEALVALPGDTNRDGLVKALMATYFTGYARSGDWLEISTGLGAMTEHARSLGYDGLVLFLDELVLWLSQRLSNAEFVNTEVSKISKLVETEQANLAVPLISFIARQRELKDFLGDRYTGAEKSSIADSFAFFEGRFNKIDLAAADLPVIVHKRLLEPKDDAAAAALSRALDAVKANRPAWNALLSGESRADEASFRLVYPFSPALIDALVALSTLLQRDRTALKILSELLSRGREELTVDDVVPIGDLFDLVLLESALSPQVARRFTNAKTFWEQKLRPLLLQQAGIRLDEVAAQPRQSAYRVRERLAKTLLVAEIAPDATSLKNLTASRISALNFGSVRAMIAGQEALQVLGWVKQWASHLPEITLGSGADPVIGLTLSEVDVESVVQRVESVDTPDERRALLKSMLSGAVGLPQPDGAALPKPHEHVWRGSRRQVDVLFGNIRDDRSLRDDQLRTENGRWRLVVDYPFDDDSSRRPADDFARLEGLRAAGLASDTIAWIPYFFTAERMDSVGRLVQLEHLLTGQRFEQNAEHLAQADRATARRQLEGQRETLRAQVNDALRQAYGLTKPEPSDVDQDSAGHTMFASLRPGLVIDKPSAATLAEGLAKVLDQALTHQYPDHPRFEPSGLEITAADVSKTLAAVHETLRTPTQRLDTVDKTRAALLRRVVPALRLGEARDNVLAVGAESFGWWREMSSWAQESADAQGAVQVGVLRTHLRDLGLARHVEDLLLLTWAALADRQFRRHGAVIPDPGIGQLGDDVVLLLPDLPTPEEWEKAKSNAAHLLGLTGEHRLSSAAVKRLAEQVRNAVEARHDPALRLVAQLREHAGLLGLEEQPPSPRLETALLASQVVADLRGAPGDTALLRALAGSPLPAEPQALAAGLASAGAVADAIAGARWSEIQTVAGTDQGAPLLQRLGEAARAEELHAKLAPVLSSVGNDAHALVLRWARQQPTPPVPAPAPVPVPGAGPTAHPVPVPEPATPTTPAAPTAPRLDVDAVEIVLPDAGSAHLADVTAQLQAFARKHPGRRIRVTWSVA
ncbi:hypothetical protein [Cellulomonas endophytica]|uniref:hypothetical protein n=1 Tax=Cellulomonas endophytica TaxID=2494735 RepID=UPI0013E94473|nr:hypothetical protein [Cellulomonas endophytica]